MEIYPIGLHALNLDADHPLQALIRQNLHVRSVSQRLGKGK